MQRGDLFSKNLKYILIISRERMDIVYSDPQRLKVGHPHYLRMFTRVGSVLKESAPSSRVLQKSKVEFYGKGVKR